MFQDIRQRHLAVRQRVQGARDDTVRSNTEVMENDPHAVGGVPYGEEQNTEQCDFANPGGGKSRDAAMAQATRDGRPSGTA
jgi:hypothetical protein